MLLREYSVCNSYNKRKINQGFKQIGWQICIFFQHFFRFTKKNRMSGRGRGGSGGRGGGRGGGGGGRGGGGGGRGGGSKVGFVKPADPSFLRRLKEQHGYKAGSYACCQN